MDIGVLQIGDPTHSYISTDASRLESALIIEAELLISTER